MLAIQKAFTIVGGQSALAKHFQIRPWAVSKWQKSGVPVERCIEIEKLTKGQVRCEELRPDIDWSVLRNSK
ncbi:MULTISPECIES: transcriptional regulator [Pasteurellaceae]|uniref:Helix-turn-helix domain-containing protein n=1 Tax=Pasteurella atlantica TaxID=2827233 RepID=A0AAW8CEP2_9PAST|nr:helix-turn-helix domain-containing protein [Pasteurella atlantica]MBR0574189.1 helix-turn-helix domain-containing protein [Pasteurella atlantica]MDP8039298.1 helix-turn-helix domain-containing protein [Pasteurella atlantica]MDP8041390.1 helix-turn-helix domain-containing protein [Pasteurella atlantica]MDP8043526.1 helix-turn-helix domain-containing protein [Pasteurella atlantica]MDP8045556.1 helix-turn-helix domain-containing protein [Pasteurella atlantica]